MSVSKLISRWRSDPGVAASIQVWHEIEARQPRITAIPEHLHPGLAAALKSQGIQSLYTHQAASLSSAQQGKNLVVVTGTASGKTLCYNLPVLNSLLRDPQSRALYLFPTKALAQDQAAALRSLIASIPKPDAADQPRPSLAIYDGDTPSHARPSIRASTRLLFSNPDMLHIGILPHHTLWAEFFSQLRLVVLDEAHIYRGVFGSHVANVIRRLRRIARFYGSNPQFILTSATIANPEQLAYRLTGCDVELINEDGSGRGPKTFLIYNPPVVDPELGLRRSALQESVRLAQDLLTYKVQAIIFGRSRRTVELMLSYLRQGGNSLGKASFSFERNSHSEISREESA